MRLAPLLQENVLRRPTGVGVGLTDGGPTPTDDPLKSYSVPGYERPTLWTTTVERIEPGTVRNWFEYVGWSSGDLNKLDRTPTHWSGKDKYPSSTENLTS